MVFFSQDPNGVWKLRKLGRVAGARAGKVQVGPLVVGVWVDFATAKISGAKAVMTVAKLAIFGRWWFGHYNLFIKVYKMLL